MMTELERAAYDLLATARGTHPAWQEAQRKWIAEYRAADRAGASGLVPRDVEILALSAQMYNALSEWYARRRGVR